MNRIVAVSASVLLVTGALVLAPSPAMAACDYFPEAPTQVIVGAGEPAFFAMPDLCYGGDPTITTPYNPESMVFSSLHNGSDSAGFTLTPPTPDFTGVGVVDVTLDFGGDEVHNYRLSAYFGVSADVVWPADAVPNPIAIEPGGTASFTLPGMYWPKYSECSIQVGTDPETDIVTGPPNIRNLPVAIEVVDPAFTGVLTVTYALSCTPPGGEPSGKTFEIVLYVGVPLPAPAPVPALADTGESPLWPAIPAGVLLLAVGAWLVGRRRVPRTASR